MRIKQNKDEMIPREPNRKEFKMRKVFPDLMDKATEAILWDILMPNRIKSIELSFFKW